MFSSHITNTYKFTCIKLKPPKQVFWIYYYSKFIQSAALYKIRWSCHEKKHRKCGDSWLWNPQFATNQRRLSESPSADFYSPFVNSKNAAGFVLKHSLWEPQNLVFPLWENIFRLNMAPDIIIVKALKTYWLKCRISDVFTIFLPDMGLLESFPRF